jgi:hypothetical protein
VAQPERRDRAQPDRLSDGGNAKSVRTQDRLHSRTARLLDRRCIVTGNTRDFLAIRNTGVNLRLENWRDDSSLFAGGK